MEIKTKKCDRASEYKFKPVQWCSQQEDLFKQTGNCIYDIIYAAKNRKRDIMQKKKDIKNYFALCLWMLIPSVYLLIRMNIISVHNVDINILGQMEWFDLIFNG